MRAIAAVVGLLAARVAVGHEEDDSREPITCGSAIKLSHTQTGHQLHSHEIKWGSGSHQQSVTGMGSRDDPNSLWVVAGGHGAPVCQRGTLVQCGEAVRLMHAPTGRNLHSHSYDAALSGQQEVSGFGDKGMGDAGDTWIVECWGAGATQWRRLEPVSLRHVDTGAYLSTSRLHEFNDGNCANCPIVGQLEVSAVPRAGASEMWRVELGILF